MSSRHSTKKITYDESPCPNPALIGPCHLSHCRKRKDGYRDLFIDGRIWLAHRYLWAQAIGPIPEGLVIDHQCRVCGCCNVDHLRIVTHKINSTENSFSVGALNKVKTHCPKGHAYDAANTRIAKNGQRICRACHRADGNARSKRNARPRVFKTHCPYGHPYDEANTYVRKSGARGCRACHRKQAVIAYYEKKGPQP